LKVLKTIYICTQTTQLKRIWEGYWRAQARGSKASGGPRKGGPAKATW
jgi:hypothetical protein